MIGQSPFPFMRTSFIWMPLWPCLRLFLNIIICLLASYILEIPVQREGYSSPEISAVEPWIMIEIPILFKTVRWKCNFWANLNFEVAEFRPVLGSHRPRHSLLWWNIVWILKLIKLWPVEWNQGNQKSVHSTTRTKIALKSTSLPFGKVEEVGKFRVIWRKGNDDHLCLNQFFKWPSKQL